MCLPVSGIRLNNMANFYPLEKYIFYLALLMAKFITTQHSFKETIPTHPPPPLCRKDSVAWGASMNDR